MKNKVIEKLKSNLTLATQTRDNSGTKKSKETVAVWHRASKLVWLQQRVYAVIKPITLM